MTACAGVPHCSPRVCCSFALAGADPVVGAGEPRGRPASIEVRTGQEKHAGDERGRHGWHQRSIGEISAQTGQCHRGRTPGVRSSQLAPRGRRSPNTPIAADKTNTTIVRTGPWSSSRLRQESDWTTAPHPQAQHRGRERQNGTQRERWLVPGKKDQPNEGDEPGSDPADRGQSTRVIMRRGTPRRRPSRRR
jgi:hypothetical protein